MKAIAIMGVLVSLAVLAGCGSSGGKVQTRGAATLDIGGYGSVRAISCAAPGDCAAGGYYHSASNSGGWRAFVINETNGSWGRAMEVPGTGKLNFGGHAYVDSISCVSAGDCAAAGSYRDGNFHDRAFVVSETNGRWGKAIALPGTTTLAATFSFYGYTAISISCAAAGECAAGGFYSDGQPAVASETNGSWGSAINVRGIAPLNPGPGIGAELDSISCGAPGYCVAGGHTNDPRARWQAFVVSETNGRWGKAMKVPGAATFADGQSAVESMSCVAAGECTAGGFSTDRRGNGGAFVVRETNGRWGTAKAVPGKATLDEVDSISCVSAGDCAAGGTYTDRRGFVQVFVISETNGTWGKAIEVPGIATLRGGYHGGSAISISCAAAGVCAAGGYYSDRHGIKQAFVVRETNGSWARGMEVPGAATRSEGGAQVLSVSCAAVGDCAAVGGVDYGGYSRGRGFVVSETNGAWGTALHSR